MDKPKITEVNSKCDFCPEKAEVRIDNLEKRKNPNPIFFCRRCLSIFKEEINSSLTKLGERKKRNLDKQESNGEYVKANPI